MDDLSTQLKNDDENESAIVSEADVTDVAEPDSH